MRKVRIGYKSFGRASLAYGLDLCLKRIEHIEAIELVSVSTHNAKSCDVLLLSVYWWQHLYDYMQFLTDAGLNPKTRKPLIVIGGFQSFNFTPLGNLYHYACIGDGEEWLPKFIDAYLHSRDIESIEGVSWPGKKDITVWQNAAFNPMSMREPGQHITRIEIARGCRYRCKFCALTYLKQYREGDAERVNQLISDADTKTVALFAPDRTSHSDYSKIQQHLEDVNKSDIASDVRLDTLKGSIKTPNHLRMGIEGVSYRLRRAVGKNYTNEDILETFRDAVNKSENKRGIHFYLVLDLPGEQDCDYEELLYIFNTINDWPEAERLTLIPFPNVFLPNPLTPLQWGGVNVFTDFGKKYRKISRASKRWNFVLAENIRMWGPMQRLKSLVAVRGDERSMNIIYNIVHNKKLKSDMIGSSRRGAEILMKFCTKNGYTEDELCGEIPVSKELPWDNIQTHVRKDVIIKSWKHYKKTMEMPDA